jgi:UDP-N-acetyl-D-mannosaminuronic acid dehydrogenase
LAFKPDIDDLRESPALDIAQQVELMGVGKLLLVEPNITIIPESFDGSTTRLVTLDEAIRYAEVIVLLVDHLQFKEMDLGLLSGKQVVDTRGSWTALRIK